MDRRFSIAVWAASEFKVVGMIDNTTRVYPPDIVLNQVYPDKEKWKLVNYPGTIEEKITGFFDWLNGDHDSEEKWILWLLAQMWSDKYSIYNSPLL